MVVTKWQWVIGLSLAAGSVAGCSSPGTGEAGENASSLQNALSYPAQSAQFDVRLPSGLKPGQVIFGANGAMKVTDSLKLLETNLSTRANIANSGSTSTEIGVQAEVKDVTSVANVFLRDRGHIFGAVRTTGSLTRQNQTIVDGAIQQRVALNPTVALSFSVAFPATADEVILYPDQSRVLVPGSYGTLTASARTVVTLSQPGAYYFRSFDLEPLSKLVVNNAAGPVYIFVAGGQFIYRSAMVKQNASLSNVLFAFAGTQQASLEAPFVGTLVAPNATASMITTQGHRGTFFAKNIDTSQPNQTIVHVAFSPGDCSTSAVACAVGLGCADLNANGKPDCGECPAGNDRTDSDGDRTLNCIDGCPADPKKTQPGACGCNSPDVDTDSDGLLDCNDCAPLDSTNAACVHVRDLPPRVDVPRVPGATPASPTAPTCNSTLPTLPSNHPTLPNGNKAPPTSSQLQSLFDAVPASGAACETPQDPEGCEPDPAKVSDLACSFTTDCASLGAQYRCQYGRPTSCSGATPNPLICKNKTKRCAIPKAECTSEPIPSGCTTPGGCACADPSNPAACGCAQFDACPDANATGNSGPSDPTVYTPVPPVSTSTKLTANKQPPPAPVFTDPIDNGTCSKPFGGNCWCSLSMDDPPPFTDGANKNADHGSGSLLSLSFKPDVHFTADLNPLPFGESTFKLDAGANFTSTAKVNILAISQAIDLIDLGANVSAGRCSISTGGSRFKVFGIDFVDLFGDQPFDSTSPSNPTLSAASSLCNSTVSTFRDAGDRAKKSLRDAQVLIQKYKALAPNTSFDKAQFCAAITPKEADFPALNCLNAPVASTINQFTKYYEARVQRLLEAQQALAASSGSLLSALRGAQPGAIKFLNINREESANLANIQFFVGPIPVNITFDVAFNYGVQGDLTYRYSPASGFGLASGSTAQLAAVSGLVTPSAGAALQLFAGVGFDVPGFAVKAGISGNLTLAVIRANLEAGAGLTMQAQDDPRATPSDLSSIGTGKLLLPNRQYQLYVDWFYSAKLGLDDVLKGSLDAKVKLKALFFSKTFKKRILTFPTPFSLPETTLFSGGSRLAGIELPAPGVSTNSLGIFEMQLPFVEVQPLAVPAADPATKVGFTLPTGNLSASTASALRRRRSELLDLTGA